MIPYMSFPLRVLVNTQKTKYAENNVFSDRIHFGIQL